MQNLYYMLKRPSVLLLTSMFAIMIINDWVWYSYFTCIYMNTKDTCELLFFPFYTKYKAILIDKSNWLSYHLYLFVMKIVGWLGLIFLCHLYIWKEKTPVNYFIFIFLMRCKAQHLCNRMRIFFFFLSFLT
jgi:hypothetical protein